MSALVRGIDWDVFNVDGLYQHVEADDGLGSCTDEQAVAAARLEGLYVDDEGYVTDAAGSRLNPAGLPHKRSGNVDLINAAVQLQRAKTLLEKWKDVFVGGTNDYVAVSRVLHHLELVTGINAAEERDAADAVFA